jgi:hypothetical protein
MLKSDLLRAIHQEIYRHDFSHFVDESPSIAQGGKGIVVSGCPACQKQIGTMPQFLDHLAKDASAVCAVKRAHRPYSELTAINKAP